MNNNTKKHRRSLREALRAILRRRREPVDPRGIVGSGILRRQEPSVYQLPTPSLISSLPDFQSSKFDLTRYEVSVQDGSNFDHPEADGVDVALHSLLPKMSMNQLKLSATTKDCSDAQKPQWNYVPTIYANDTSLQASMVTFDTVRHSVSTLKLQRSTQSLQSISTMTSSSTFSTPSISRTLYSSPNSPIEYNTPRRRPSRLNRRMRSTQLHTIPSVPEETQPVQKDSRIKHFSSFCVLDTTAVGCPVIATSKDLRYIFDIGEQFCLNNSGIQNKSMDLDIVTGYDAAGDPITHLVLYSPLIIPSSGRSRFVLASLIDITNFINNTATLPELDFIENSIIEEEIITPTSIHRQHIPKCELSAEDLLGGCYVPNVAPRIMDQEDVWLDLATTERKPCRSNRSAGTRTPQSNSTSSIVDEVLDEFLRHLQELYSDFFLLGRSPLDDDSYEICNVSPRVFASKEYIDGHLSHTSHKQRMRLEEQLILDEAFEMSVKWGTQGKPKQLHCVPLFGRSTVTWACFLVEIEMSTKTPYS